jgi:ferredoxin-NADP reductase
MKFRVINETLETSHCKTIHLRAETPILDYRFKAGQYCILEIELNGTTYKRCYSFTSSENNSNEISLTIKKVEFGKVSNYLVDTSMTGAILNISIPYGDFHRHMFIEKKPLLFLAAGSGITPIFSMIKTLAGNRDQPVTLLYFNQNLLHTIFYDQLKQLDLLHEHLDIHMFATKQSCENLIAKRLSSELIKMLCSNFSDFQVAICGPKSFMQEAHNICNQLGIEDELIFKEQFTNNLNGVVKQELAADNLLNVTFSCIGKQIKVPKNSVLLEVAEAHGIKIPNVCGIGSCGECKVKLNMGEVDMFHIGGLNPKDESNGFILSCCSLIQGDLHVSMN